MKYMNIAIAAGRLGIKDVFLTDGVVEFESTTGFKVVDGKVRIHGVVFHFYEKAH